MPAGPDIQQMLAALGGEGASIPGGAGGPMGSDPAPIEAQAPMPVAEEPMPPVAPPIPMQDPMGGGGAELPQYVTETQPDGTILLKAQNADGSPGVILKVLPAQKPSAGPLQSGQY